MARHQMTNAEKNVLDAARKWAEERSPKTRDEKALMVAVARAWPDDWQTKEACDCGEQDECDECLTRDQVEAMIAHTERELAQSVG